MIATIIALVCVTAGFFACTWWGYQVGYTKGHSIATHYANERARDLLKKVKEQSENIKT